MSDASFLMKKLFVLALVVGFAATSAFAGSCGGCEGGKKDDKKKEEPKKENVAPQI